MESSASIAVPTPSLSISHDSHGVQLHVDIELSFSNIDYFKRLLEMANPWEAFLQSTRSTPAPECLRSLTSPRVTPCNTPPLSKTPIPMTPVRSPHSQLSPPPPPSTPRHKPSKPRLQRSRKRLFPEDSSCDLDIGINIGGDKCSESRFEAITSPTKSRKKSDGSTPSADRGIDFDKYDLPELTPDELAKIDEDIAHYQASRPLSVSSSTPSHEFGVPSSFSSTSSTSSASPITLKDIVVPSRVSNATQSAIFPPPASSQKSSGGDSKSKKE